MGGLPDKIPRQPTSSGKDSPAHWKAEKQDLCGTHSCQTATQGLWRQYQQLGRALGLKKDRRSQLPSAPEASALRIDGTPDVAESLKERAYQDLRIRARGGILIYAVVWLFIAHWAQLHTTVPRFALINTLIILTLAAARAVHYQAHRFWPELSRSTLQASLTALILAGACHWGLLTAYILLKPQLADLHLTFVVVIAALALGGTTILSISNVIRISYPLMLLVPTIFAFASVGSEEFMLLLFLAFFSMLYVYVSSAVSASDYWRALEHESLADERTALVEKLSIIDPLTQANNRLHLMKEFDAVWRRCSEAAAPMSLLMIDLDHFKDVNDTYGHLCGDACLAQTARQISECIRKSDLSLARYGGEEFIILLPDVSLSNAGKMAERIRLAVADMHFEYQGMEVPVSCSIGVACTVPTRYNNPLDLIQQADQALYSAKNEGRNRCVLADETGPYTVFTPAHPANRQL